MRSLDLNLDINGPKRATIIPAHNDARTETRTLIHMEGS